MNAAAERVREQLFGDRRDKIPLVGQDHVAQSFGTLECDTARNEAGSLRAKPGELFGEERFEASRTRGEEGLHAHGGFSMMDWTGFINGTGA